MNQLIDWFTNQITILDGQSFSVDKNFVVDSPAEFLVSIRTFVFPEAFSILLLTQVSQEKLGKWSREEFEHYCDDSHGIS